MQKWFRLFVLTLLSSVSGWAALLSPIGKPANYLEASEIKVPLYAKVEAAPSGLGKHSLELAGAGLREKSVFVARVNVYILASYQETKENPKSRALELTFLRDLSSDQIRSAFTDSLKHNAIDPSQAEVAQVLNKLDMDFKKGSKLTLLGITEKPGKDALFVEAGTKVFAFKGTSLVDKFWKIWYGEPADSGLKDLKETLLGKKPA